MKDKSKIRLISIGFFSGIIFAGLLFLIINSVHGLKNQNSVSLHPENVKTGSILEAQNSEAEKVDINKASLSELSTLPGIGETKANAIIEFREKYGLFENVSELTYVPGIGNSLLKSIQDLVIIN